MTDSTKFTLGNTIHSKLAIVTYQITEGDGTVVKLTVPQDGTVQHPTKADNGPWKVSVIVSGMTSNASSNKTASETITDPNATISCSVDQILGKLILSGNDDVEATSVSVLDRPSTWGGEDKNLKNELGASRNLDLDMQEQAQNNWCWAAVTSSVAEFYHDPQNYPQCSLANWAFNQESCCIDGSTNACDQPFILTDALTHVGHLNQRYPRTLTLAEVTTQIDMNSGHPVALRIQWNNGGGHIVAIDAYNTDNDPSTITIKDPWGPQTSVVPFDSFPADYNGGGTWTHSYTTD